MPIDPRIHQCFGEERCRVCGDLMKKPIQTCPNPLLQDDEKLEPNTSATMNPKLLQNLISAAFVTLLMAVAYALGSIPSPTPKPAEPPKVTTIDVGHSYYRITDVIVPAVNPFKTEATKPVSFNVAVVTDIKRDYVQYNLSVFDVKNASLIESTGLSMTLWAFENIYRPLEYETNATILWK